MVVKLHKKINYGAYADLYTGTDDLGRDVAVKLIRLSVADAKFAIDQAKALARVEHPNVVRVYTIEDVIDPDTKQTIKGIVMELLTDQTLDQLLLGPSLEIEAAKQIGMGLIGGLEHIHKQGLIHNDLHASNIMVDENKVKIIDLMYEGSLAKLSQQTIQKRIQKDLVCLRLNLEDIINASKASIDQFARFRKSVSNTSTIEDMRMAFLNAIEGQEQDITQLLEYAFDRVNDQGFVEGEKYARALSRETVTEVVRPLIEKMIDTKASKQVHVEYLKTLWARLLEHDRVSILQQLSTEIYSETPTGRWVSLLSMLKAFGETGWNGLQEITQIRLEKLITDDILKGRYDIYGSHLASGGTLGTWVKAFGTYFEDLNQAAENIIVLLYQGWYTQNYIGKYFLPRLPWLAGKTGKREEFIAAIASAIRNDAKIIVSQLKTLPPDWIEELVK